MSFTESIRSAEIRGLGKSPTLAQAFPAEINGRTPIPESVLGENSSIGGGGDDEVDRFAEAGGERVAGGGEPGSGTERGIGKAQRLRCR